MTNDTFHKNLEVIARGNGSPQARDHDEGCEMCNEIRDMRPMTETTGGGYKMKKCDCGKEITQEQEAINISISQKSRTPKLDMCNDCWIDYVFHATTGE